MLWERRSYQSRCIGASSTIVSRSFAANASMSSSGVVESATTPSYLFTQVALYCRTQ
jgi:hypothetical protein